ncbi:MAG: VCBS repeat-containing protein, partial [Planctomycetaceae bacterium]|nr:VCBS repeat-containing protein [Planctomycetaceae bacterium]
MTPAIGGCFSDSKSEPTVDSAVTDVAPSGSTVGLAGDLEAAARLFRAGRFAETRDRLTAILAVQPNHVQARQQLAKLLCGCGEYRQGRQHLRILLGQQAATFDDLVLLALNGRSLFSPTDLQRAESLQQNAAEADSSSSSGGPGLVPDELVTVGLFETAIENRNVVRAAEILDAAVRQLTAVDVAPGHWPLPIQVCRLKQSQIGGLPDDQSAEEQIAAICDSLPGTNTDASEVWETLAGLVPSRNTAIACLREAVIRDPWNRRLLSEVADRLAAEDSTGTADSADSTNTAKLSSEFRQLSATLREIEESALSVRRLGPHQAAGSAVLQHLVQRLRQVGRYAEAQTWATVAGQHVPVPQWAADILRNRQTDADGVDAVVVPASHPIHRVASHDMSTTTEPASAVSEELRRLFGQQRVTDDGTSAFRFTDVASTVGLNFRYDNGAEVDAAGLQMHQWTGGGVGVVDIDGDSRPDLFFPQGNPEKPDTLFRNVLGQQFDDVTGAAVDHVRGFGQGVAVGDINHDGFDD